MAKLCLQCGEVEIPDNHQFCDVCKVKRKRQKEARNKRKLNRRGLGDDEAEIIVWKPWVPKPKPAPIMSDEEQQEIEKQIIARDIKRMGLTFDHGRLLTRAEIDALLIKGEITPIAQIQQKHELFMESWIF